MSELIGFIGLGRMGFPIALTLAKAGHDVVAFDVAPRADVVDQLGKAHARMAESLSDVVADRDIVITNLPDSSAVDAVLRSEAVTRNLRPGMVWIEMSSGYPADTRRFAASLATEHGVEMVDAPICNGGVPAAYQGRLTLCLGGTEDAVERVRPVLAVVASDILHVDAIGEGHVIKLLSNYVKLGICGLMSELYAIAAASGVDAQRVTDALRHCVAAKFTDLDLVQQELLSAPPEGPPLFRLALARKDLRYLAAHAASLGVFSPIADGAHALYLVAERVGFADAGDVRGTRIASDMLASGDFKLASVDEARSAAGKR